MSPRLGMYLHYLRKLNRRNRTYWRLPHSGPKFPRYYTFITIANIGNQNVSSLPQLSGLLTLKAFPKFLRCHWADFPNQTIYPQIHALKWYLRPITPTVILKWWEHTGHRLEKTLVPFQRRHLVRVYASGLLMERADSNADSCTKIVFLLELIQSPDLQLRQLAEICNPSELLTEKMKKISRQLAEGSTAPTIAPTTSAAQQNPTTGTPTPLPVPESAQKPRARLTLAFVSWIPPGKSLIPSRKTGKQPVVQTSLNRQKPTEENVSDTENGSDNESDSTPWSKTRKTLLLEDTLKMMKNSTVPTMLTLEGRRKIYSWEAARPVVQKDIAEASSTGVIGHSMSISISKLYNISPQSNSNESYLLPIID